MLKRPGFTAAALSVAYAAALAHPASAADDQGLAQMRDEIRQIRQQYEARIQALEKRLQAAETQSAQAAQAAPSAPPQAVPGQAPAPAPAAAAPSASLPARSAASAFNPEISLTLGGTYARLSQDPEQFRIQGFVPGGEEIGPGRRSFALGESELTLRASIDPRFSGQLSVGLTPDNEAEVEEAFFEGRGWLPGINLKGGRFLSAIGYQNSQHAHTWDFVDLPLAYQALFGGQYAPDGVQARWVAPTERFLEFGLEAGSGASFPGTDRNRNGIGSTALFAHTGDDIGASASWGAGLSYLRTRASDRAYEDSDSSGTGVVNAISGRSHTWIVDGVFKWAPDGNATRTHVKLQAEYFRRRESGTLAYDTLAQSLGTAEGAWSSAQSGWYLQGVYQFQPRWRAGLRYDKLISGTPSIGLLSGGALGAGDFPRLASYNPTRTSLMFDYSPSEFSRFRIQLARDKSRPEGADNQLFIQYIMNLGAHGAHTF